MTSARRIVGPNRVLAGNVDPMVLYGSTEKIEAAVTTCISQAGGGRHVLNLGHGVEKDMSEAAVATFINAARRIHLNK